MVANVTNTSGGHDASTFSFNCILLFSKSVAELYIITLKNIEIMTQ